MNKLTDRSPIATDLDHLVPTVGNFLSKLRVLLEKRDEALSIVQGRTNRDKVHPRLTSPQGQSDGSCSNADPYLELRVVEFKPLLPRIVGVED
jgi:hypothetical protein